MLKITVFATGYNDLSEPETNVFPLWVHANKKFLNSVVLCSRASFVWRQHMAPLAREPYRTRPAVTATSFTELSRHHQLFSAADVTKLPQNTPSPPYSQRASSCSFTPCVLHSHPFSFIKRY